MEQPWHRPDESFPSSSGQIKSHLIRALHRASREAECWFCSVLFKFKLHSIVRVYTSIRWSYPQWASLPTSMLPMAPPGKRNVITALSTSPQSTYSWLVAWPVAYTDTGCSPAIQQAMSMSWMALSRNMPPEENDLHWQGGLANEIFKKKLSRGYENCLVACWWFGPGNGFTRRNIGWPSAIELGDAADTGSSLYTVYTLHRRSGKDELEGGGTVTDSSNETGVTLSLYQCSAREGRPWHPTRWQEILLRDHRRGVSADDFNNSGLTNTPRLDLLVDTPTLRVKAPVQNTIQIIGILLLLNFQPHDTKPLQPVRYTHLYTCWMHRTESGCCWWQYRSRPSFPRRLAPMASHRTQLYLQ